MSLFLSICCQKTQIFSRYSGSNKDRQRWKGGNQKLEARSDFSKQRSFLRLCVCDQIHDSTLNQFRLDFLELLFPIFLICEYSKTMQMLVRWVAYIKIMSLTNEQMLTKLYLALDLIIISNFDHKYEDEALFPSMATI